MGSAIIVAAITYGAGLLTLLVAVHAVVCVGTDWVRFLRFRTVQLYGIDRTVRMLLFWA